MITAASWNTVKIRCKVPYQVKLLGREPFMSTGATEKSLHSVHLHVPWQAVYKAWGQIKLPTIRENTGFLFSNSKIQRCFILSWLWQCYFPCMYLWGCDTCKLMAAQQASQGRLLNQHTATHHKLAPRNTRAFQVQAPAKYPYKSNVTLLRSVWLHGYRHQCVTFVYFKVACYTYTM